MINEASEKVYADEIEHYENDLNHLVNKYYKSHSELKFLWIHSIIASIIDGR